MSLEVLNLFITRRNRVGFVYKIRIFFYSLNGLYILYKSQVP